MNCTDFEAWLLATSDVRQRTLSAEAEEHLAQCAACRGRWQAEALLDEAIQAWKSAPLPKFGAATDSSPMTARISAGMRSPRQKQLGWGSSLALATACLVLAMASWRLAFQPEAKRSPSVATAADTVVPLSESVSTLFAGLQAAPPSVVAEAARRMEQLPVLPKAAGRPEATESTTPPMPGTTTDPSAVVPSWWPLGDPIRDKVHAAFGFLENALPLPLSG
jgi:hypothetical protein